MLLHYLVPPPGPGFPFAGYNGHVVVAAIELRAATAWQLRALNEGDDEVVKLSAAIERAQDALTLNNDIATALNAAGPGKRTRSSSSSWIVEFGDSYDLKIAGGAVAGGGGASGGGGGGGKSDFVIISASYGVLGQDQATIDVTNATQQLVDQQGGKGLSLGRPSYY